MRICSGVGCLRAIPEDQRFCLDCGPQPKPTDGIRSHTLTDRERYGSLYGSSRWTRLRAQVVREQPMCARCRKALTAIVDHVIPAGIAIVQAQESGKYQGKYAGFYLRSNLQGLCRACHYVKTDEDKGHTGAWQDVTARDAHAPKRQWSF